MLDARRSNTNFVRFDGVDLFVLPLVEFMNLIRRTLRPRSNIWRVASGLLYIRMKKRLAIFDSRMSKRVAINVFEVERYLAYLLPTA